MEEAHPDKETEDRDRQATTAETADAAGEIGPTTQEIGTEAIQETEVTVGTEEDRDPHLTAIDVQDHQSTGRDHTPQSRIEEATGQDLREEEEQPMTRETSAEPASVTEETTEAMRDTPRDLFTAGTTVK